MIVNIWYVRYSITYYISEKTRLNWNKRTNYESVHSASNKRIKISATQEVLMKILVVLLNAVNHIPKKKVSNELVMSML